MVTKPVKMASCRHPSVIVIAALLPPYGFTPRRREIRTRWVAAGMSSIVPPA